jgi:hypothetical protein
MIMSGVMHLQGVVHIHLVTFSNVWRLVIESGMAPKIYPKDMLSRKFLSVVFNIDNPFLYVRRVKLQRVIECPH